MAERSVEGLDMLLEMDIKFLNELRIKNRIAYERKLRILGISDADIPYRDIVRPSQTSSSGYYTTGSALYSSYTSAYYHNPIFDEVHYIGGSPYAGPGEKKKSTVCQSRKDKGKENCFKTNMHQKNAKQNTNAKKSKKQVTVDLYIDAENVGAQHADTIVHKAERKGKIIQKKYYGRQKDGSLEPWKEKGKEHDIKPILVSKEPEKNKVDNKITKDIRKSLKNGTCADEIIIATSDGGYKDIIEEAQAAGKKVTILGEKKAPKKLRNAADQFEKV